MVAVELYTTPYCPYCLDAKDLLRRKGVDFKEINVAGAPDRKSEMIARAGGRTSVPQIFVGSTHVGGCDDLYALDRDGRLDSLLASATADASGPT